MIERGRSYLGSGEALFRKVFRNAVSILIVILIVLVIALAVLTDGTSLSPGNIRNIVLQSSARGIAAVGQTFVILTAGIDLAVGGTALLAAVFAASLMTSRAESLLLGVALVPAVAILAMLLLGLGVGILNGFSVSRIGMPALIVTLAMWQITRGAAYQICRGFTITDLPRSVAWFGQGTIVAVPVPVLVFVLVAGAGYLVLNYTSFGRSVYAVGGNPTSARLSGIDVRAIIFSVYLISGTMAALAGLVLMSRGMSASMMTAGGLELDSIAAVVIGGVSLMGGRGSLAGVVLGVLIIGAVNNGMNVVGLDPAFQDLVRGAIIFGAVAADRLRR